MRHLSNFGRLLFLLAALWAIGAGLYLLFSPFTIQGVTATSTAGGSGTVETFTRQASWYEIQGPWGIIVLVIFATLYAFAGFFAWRRRYLALGIFMVLALTLTGLAGFSIGLFYLPAAIASLAGVLFLMLSRFFPGQSHP